MRGTAATPESAVDLAFRLGAQSVDLEVALRAGRLEHARRLSERLARDVSSLDSPVLAVQYRDLSRRIEVREESGSPRGLLELSRQLAGFMAEDPQIEELSLTFGRWCEAGRLAALSGNRELLTSDEYRGFLRRLAERSGRNRRIAAEIERLRDLLGPELDDLQTAAIGASLRAILAES